MYLKEIGRDGINWLRIGTRKAGSCECGNENSSSIKCTEFTDYMRNY
jgi:hypothetical protein